MNRLSIRAAVGTVSALVLITGPATPVAAQPKQLNTYNATVINKSDIGFLDKLQVERSISLWKQRQIALELSNNQARLTKAVGKTKKYVGKTWYVFSGTTPGGWDCSGLVRWTYEQVGVTLEHSASKQAHSGKRVKTPMVGDIVAFYYPSSKSTFHVGIYIGDGKVLHAYRKGTRTRIDSIAKIAKDNHAKYKYIRVMPMPSNA